MFTIDPVFDGRMARIACLHPRNTLSRFVRCTAPSFQGCMLRIVIRRGGLQTRDPGVVDEDVDPVASAYDMRHRTLPLSLLPDIEPQVGSLFSWSLLMPKPPYAVPQGVLRWIPKSHRSAGTVNALPQFITTRTPRCHDCSR
jgi:hypothetical protein